MTLIPAALTIPSHMASRRLLIVIVASAMLAGCAALAIRSAPNKTRSAERTAAALRADELFWGTLHGGQYDRIPEALRALTAAYLGDPNDPVTAAHVGFLHIWRLAERARLAAAPPDPGITDHALLARRYFEEAVRLDPTEARYAGFHATLLMTEGAIHRDERLLRRGYFTMRAAIDAWPEFNYFTAGYTFTRQPHDSARFREGLEYFWLNLDACADERVDRTSADFARSLGRETKTGPKRACWNSWIAPHNFEGFFLSFGDVLVKAGDPATAVKMYANAKLAPDYAAWPYRDVLEDRLANAGRYVEAFRQSDPTPGAPAMMSHSTFSCMGCHQR